MPRTKILFPFDGDCPVGGSHISALKLIHGLDRSRFEPLIVLLGASGEAAELIHQEGLDVDTLGDAPMMSSPRSRRVQDGSALTYATGTHWKLRSYIKRQNADIIHTNDGQIHVNWGIAAKSAGRKLVWHHRQDPTAIGVNKIAPFIADRIVCVSDFARPANPIRPVERITRVVRSPFDFATACPDKPEARAKLSAEIEAGDNAVLIGYFGNLVDRKRPLQFVRAIRAIQNALPDRDVRGLLFGGAAPGADDLDKRITALASELGLASNIHLMGFRTPIDGYMAAVDATLVTAVNEPFGRTLIEAMHLRTPVVAVRHGGNIEAIEDGETGFLVDVEDAEAFADPVVKLILEQDLRDRITRRAEELVHQSLSVERHVEKISEVYEDLIPETG